MHPLASKQPLTIALISGEKLSGEFSLLNSVFSGPKCLVLVGTSSWDRTSVMGNVHALATKSCEKDYVDAMVQNPCRRL